MIHQQYIDSGILEAYVMGSASEAEVKELMYMKTKYPEVNLALQQLETDMENIAQQMAVAPPARTWGKISDTIDDLIMRPNNDPDQYHADREDRNYRDFNKGKTGSDYIEVESESNQIRINKAWKWVFAGVFVLAKIFLGLAIYFYLENRQAQIQLKEIKTELKQLKR